MKVSREFGTRDSRSEYRQCVEVRSLDEGIYIEIYIKTVGGQDDELWILSVDEGSRVENDSEEGDVGRRVDLMMIARWPLMMERLLWLATGSCLRSLRNCSTANARPVEAFGNHLQSLRQASKNL